MYLLVTDYTQGEAKITPGFDLPAKHVIHTVGVRRMRLSYTSAESTIQPVYNDEEEDAEL